MAEGSASVRVNVPPDQVFPYVADLETAPEWVPDLVSMKKVSDGEVGVGTRYAEVVQMGKSTADAELEVTAYEPHRLFAHKGQGGPSRFTGRFVMEPDGDGTKVTHQYTVTMTGFYRVLSPFVRGWVRKNAEEGLENLKKTLEQR